MQNEPNSGPAPGGTRPGGRGAWVRPCETNPFRQSAKTPGADCAKRTQFSRRCPAGRVWRAGIVEGNRAKQSQFRRSGRMGKYLAGKDLWRIEHAGGFRKTKPIDEGYRAKQSQSVTARGTNKGDSPMDRNGRGPKGGRRQAQACETNPIPGRMGENRQSRQFARRDQSYKQSQFPGAPGDGRVGGAIAWAYCAKQTQFSGPGSKVSVLG